MADAAVEDRETIGRSGSCVNPVAGLIDGASMAFTRIRKTDDELKAGILPLDHANRDRHDLRDGSVVLVEGDSYELATFFLFVAVGCNEF